MSYDLSAGRKIENMDTGSAIFDSKIYTVKSGTTYTSDDWGETFTSVTNNLPTADYYLTHFTKDGTMIVSKTRQVFRAVYPYTEFTNVVNLTTTGSRVLRWGFTQDNDGVLYMTEYGNYVDTVNGGYVNIMYWYKSTNDGLSWTKHDNLQTRDTKHFHQIKVNPFTNVLYVTTGDMNKLLFKSTDKGETWEEVIPTTYPSKTAENTNYGGFTGIGFFENGEILWGTDWQPRDPDTGQYWNWYVKSVGDDVNSFTYEKMPKAYYGFAGDIMTDQVTGEAWMSLTDEFGESDVYPALMYTNNRGATWKPLVELPVEGTLNGRRIIAYSDNSIKDSPFIFWDVIGEGIMRVDRNLKPQEDAALSENVNRATFYLNLDGRIYEVDLFNNDGVIRDTDRFIGS